MPGEVITFYSYKGGTGRTMALANAAVLFSQLRDGDVLVIDWDLEAPGLHRFFEDSLSSALKSRSHGLDAVAGLMDVFEAARVRLDGMAQAPDEDDRGAAREFWDTMTLGDYILRTDIPSLHLLKAGQFDERYAERVNTFDWEDLSVRFPGAFRGFVDALAERYRYVLIDSRTGITDTSGICTTLLPEKLVVVFTPNRQSLTGVIELVRRATEYRRQSDDLRPLTVFPVASRVEVSEDELRQRWRYGDRSGLLGSGSQKRFAFTAGGESGADRRLKGYQPSFEAAFREAYDLDECDLEQYFNDVQVQHSTRFSYGEEIAVLKDSSSDRLSLARSYERLARALVITTGPWALEAEARPREPEDAERDKRVVKGVEGQQSRFESRANWADGWRRRARLMQISVLSVTAIAIVVATLLSTTTSALLLGAAGAVLLAALELALLALWPRRRQVVDQAAANALGRELFLYESRGGRYARAELPAVELAERAEDIIAEADARLARVRVVSELRGPDVDGR
jgi:MinD-like ATPase involved in chromosome partitioning or flagellar assembly